MLKIIALTATLAVSTAAADPITPPIPEPPTDHPRCAPLQEQLSVLQHKYGEVPIFAGSVGLSPRTVILTANPQGSSWSYLATDPTGKLCLLDAGGGFKLMLTKRVAPSPAKPKDFGI